MTRRAAFAGVCLLALAACDGIRSADSAPAEPKRDALASCLSTAAPASPAELAGVRRELRLPPPSSENLEPLTSCEVYRLTEREPVYLGRLDEGNVAPYGIVLSAEPSRPLAERLLSQEKDGQWEYSAGYGPTSADTAMVLEGLLLAGTDRRRLTKSLGTLARDYSDEASGGFLTVRNGRARYWQGASTETTAHIAYLMHRVDAAAFAPEIERARRFVLQHQDSDGHWDGRWFSSRVLPTYHAVRFLAAVGGQQASLSRAAHFVVQLQRADGSFAGSVMETALAVLTLRSAGGSSEAIARARAWLRARAAADSCVPGEPFLHYWFEPDEQTRLFLSCVDRGPIGRALASLALSP